MTLPNYLVIGAQKSATSSVCDLLSGHPEVFMTAPKEPYFFSHDEYWSRGLGWYESLFEGAEGCLAIGDGSTTYSQCELYPNAVERIAQHLPGVKLIYIVRNPLERIQSHWMHYRSKGDRETKPFHIAVRERPEYIDNSRYCKQIDQHRVHHSDDRILTLFFEHFKQDPNAVMRRAFAFLGVDPSYVPEDAGKPRHVSAKGRVDTPLLRPLRHLPGFDLVRDSMPAGLREGLRRVMKKPIEGRPEWDDESRRYVIERLADDNRAFLKRYGKPEDYWGIDWGS